MGLQYHIRCREGDVAPYVLLPGDPGRVPIVAAQWDESHLVAQNREYTTYTGLYKGVPISCTSTGIGCPSTAIALEELARLGARVFIRIGTCGTYQDHVQNGDLAIFDAAMRYDGTSHLYVPPEFPAVASIDVVQALVDAAKALGARHHVGITRSADCFYARHSRPGSSFNNFWQSDWADFQMDLKRLGVLGAEMEASIILVLARVWGLRAGACAVVLDNVLKVTHESGHLDPEAAFAHAKEPVQVMARVASEAVRLIHQRDQIA
ncbi:MAG: nucleoside phosphorylase [Chloroflexi bacterium]|nr:nucleoside phosphorylase [Chloroflexota bacterium]